MTIKTWLEVACNLSEMSLLQAAMQVGPSFSYTLHTTHSQRFEAYDLARRAQMRDHPFAPYINVVLDVEHRPASMSQEWYLVNDMTGDTCGSPAW